MPIAANANKRTEEVSLLNYGLNSNWLTFEDEVKTRHRRSSGKARLYGGQILRIF
jgi:hypothetical protein